MKVYVTDLDGNTKEIEGKAGWTLMEVIRDDGMPIKAECGGACACATCHVYVDAAWADKLPAPDADEHGLVSDEPTYQPNSRLSCQIEMTDAMDGLTVTIAPEA